MLIFKNLFTISTVLIAGFLMQLPEVPDANAANLEFCSVKSDTFEVSNIQIGIPVKGINFLTVTIRNKTAENQILGINIRTSPGIWLRNAERQEIFQLKPYETKTLEAGYSFLGMSSEASLILKFGVPVIDPHFGFYNIRNIFYQKTYDIGKNVSPQNDEVFSQFRKHETDHFEIYYFDGSLAEKEIDKISQIRESGITEIEKVLSVKNPGKIRLFFFPDEEIKKNKTGHMGVGWAFRNNIVEVYNDSTKLDPYHEITHIVAGQLGNPPALFDEGLAVYMSEKLGADALQFLGNPGISIDSCTHKFILEKKTFPLSTLFDFTDIGNNESVPLVSYPQSASIVKYLIETYGIEKFINLYKSLQNSSDPQVKQENRDIVKKIYGQSLQELEKQWLSRF